MSTLKYRKNFLLSVFVTTILASALLFQPVSANTSLRQEVIDVNVAVEKSKEVKVQKASKDLIYQIRKRIHEETPKAFKILLKKMESDNKLSLNLTHAIGSKDTKEVNDLLAKATKAKMNIDYFDSNSDILRFRLCANFNGVRHCFPSQRNSLKCPKW